MWISCVYLLWYLFGYRGLYVLYLTKATYNMKEGPTHCLNCGKELVQPIGRRQKHYCDRYCSVTYWQSNNKKNAKYVQVKTFQDLQDKFNELQKKYDELKDAIA